MAGEPAVRLGFSPLQSWVLVTLGDSFPGKLGDCLEESGRLCTFVILGHSNSPQPETVETHLHEHFLAHRCLFHGHWLEGFSARG